MGAHTTQQLRATALMLTASLVVCAASATAQTRPESASPSTSSTSSSGSSAGSSASAAAASTPRHGSFFSARGVAIVVGLGGAVAAGAIAIKKDHAVQQKRAQLLGIPAGATADWDRVQADARGLEHERNFWEAVSIGVGGVTIGYWIASSESWSPSPMRAPVSRGTAVTWTAGGWTIRAAAPGPFVSVTRGF